MTTPTCGPTPPGCRQTAACDLDIACRNPPCEAGYHHPSSVSTLCIRNDLPPVHVPAVSWQTIAGSVAISILIVVMMIISAKLVRR